MRILLTNDDGVHAPGLKVLEGIARRLSEDVVIVAPESDQSGVAHSLSLNNPLRLREIGPRRFAVQGTPSDCVIMGVRRLFADARPDLILSGVNRGQNVAEDVTYSGTIAAAMEGALIGVPSIALSQAYDGREGRDKPNWDCATTLGPTSFAASSTSACPTACWSTSISPPAPPPKSPASPPPCRVSATPS